MPEGAAILRPWTIKAMPEDLTERAAKTARRNQETVAELVSRALVRELDSPLAIVRSDQSPPSIPPAADQADPIGDFVMLGRLAVEMHAAIGDHPAAKSVLAMVRARAIALRPRGRSDQSPPSKPAGRLAAPQDLTASVQSPNNADNGEVPDGNETQSRRI